MEMLRAKYLTAMRCGDAYGGRSDVEAAVAAAAAVAIAGRCRERSGERRGGEGVRRPRVRCAPLHRYG